MSVEKKEPIYEHLEKTMLSSIEKTPRLLPFELEFTEVFPGNLYSIHQMYKLLDNNYIEDEESALRFNYVHEFLGRVLRAPNWNELMCLGLIFKGDYKLVGTIASIPKLVVMNDHCLNSCEINFLCLKKKLRKKDFTQHLIREKTRRLNILGILQAFYTTGLCFEKYLTNSRYYHIPLNIHKLKNFGYCSDEIQKLNFKKINNYLKEFSEYKREIYSVYENFRYSQTKLELYQIFRTIDFNHFFRSLEGIFFCFGSTNQTYQCFICLFSLPSKLIRLRKKDFVYSVQYFYSTMHFRQTKFFLAILNFLLKIGFDILNIVQGSSTSNALKNIDLTKGTGVLQYHVFNLSYDGISIEKNSLVFY